MNRQSNEAFRSLFNNTSSSSTHSDNSVAFQSNSKKSKLSSSSSSRSFLKSNLDTDVKRTSSSSSIIPDESHGTIHVESCSSGSLNRQTKQFSGSGRLLFSEQERDSSDLDQEDEVSDEDDEGSLELDSQTSSVADISSSSSSSSSSSQDSSRKSSPFKQKLVKLFIPKVDNNSSSNNGSSYQTRLRLALERAVTTRLENHNRNIPRQNWFVRQIDILLLKLFVIAMKHHRELCIIFLLFASGLASFRSGPMKTRATPAPKPFFTSVAGQKYITDFYRGEYVDLVQRRISLGPSFVFYYAPWDSESLAARSIFVEVAQHFHRTVPGQVRFFAVNCWWPEGECRKNYKTLSHFPIFVGHVGKTAGIIYSGPIRTELMIKFFSSLVKPLTRLDTETEIWRFRASHDAIMVGYFNFSDPQSASAYETFLHMALRNYESDPFGQVGYGVLLRKDLAEKYFLTSSSVISLVLFNEIHTAKWTGSHFDQGIKGPVGQVANWVIERTRKTPITWAYQIRTGFANRPVALGPTDLTTELKKGPVVLLITRRYYPSSFSPFYSQVKEVALDYFNCNKSGNVTKLRRTTHRLTAEWMSLWNSISKICLEVTQGPITESCLKMTEQLNHWNRRKSVLKRESLANYESLSERLNFTGFSCASTRNFKFFAIDPTDIPHFVDLGLEGLGYNEDSDPIMLVIDAPNDVIIPLKSFNISAIAEFIHWYTSESEGNGNGKHLKGLSQYWIERETSISVSNSRKLPTCAVHERKGFSFIQEITGSGDGIPVEVPLGDDDVNEITSSDSPHPNILVKSMSSQDLLDLTHKTDSSYTPLFVMFTAKFCGMCGIGLGSFLELSRFLTYYDSSINVTFAKIDMWKNSLPEELSPVNLPTFVYFPSNNLSDGRVFPAEVPISTKTLLRFLLSELDANSRVKLSLMSPGCNSQLQSNSCVASQGKKMMVDSNCPNSSRFKYSSTNSSLKKENCLNANKASVSDRIQNILNRIQNGFLSQMELELGGISRNSDEWNSEEEQTSFVTSVKASTELEHLRSMKLTLEVS